MALMSEIVDDVLTELRLANGQGVQVHLQGSITKNISRVYRTLNRRHTFKDYVTYSTFTLDGVTGIPTTAVPSTLDRYSKIAAVFREQDTDPLPFVANITNIARLRRPTVIPSGEAHFFKVLPAQSQSVTVVSKSYQDADFDMDDEVPFDRDLLSLGAAFMLSTKQGTNDKLTADLGRQFSELLNIALLEQLKDFPINLYRGTYPTEWHESP